MPGTLPSGEGGLQGEACGRQGGGDEKRNGDREDRRCAEQLLHTSVFRRRLPCAAPPRLSVRSHVNSGSVRPKCPNAAVFL